MNIYDKTSDFDFYVNLYLKYISDVDEMALEKKRKLLRRLLVNSVSDADPSIEQSESASNCSAHPFTGF
jgi:hypothetical protein